MTVSEEHFKDRVIQVAKARGWKVFHALPAQIRPGRYATPMQGHAGFPDLVLARDGQVLLRELKSETGRLSPGQKEWLAALGEHGGLWRPGDLTPSILAALR